MKTHPLEPSITHIRSGYDVYIGRTMRDVRFTNRGWGNPFHMTRQTADGGRETAIAQYRTWVMRQPRLLARIDAGELDGKRLGCWCKPADCHGDVLLDLWRARRLPMLISAQA